jgi:hypothetical protein
VPLSLDEIEAGVSLAFDEFLAAYAEDGGHRHRGFLGADNPRTYKLPLLWTEGDCQWRFALALEKQFPEMVHLEMPLAGYTVRDFDRRLDARQFIDIVVSDLSDFDPESMDFAERQHDVFIEVKYVGHGTSFVAVGKRTISQGVRGDLERLKRNLEKKRCRRAAMLLIDDANHVEGDPGKGLPWSPAIRPLLANPTQLKRRRWAQELGVTLPPSCPGCGSPRVAAILWGLPGPVLEPAFRDHELFSGGCEVLGHDLDPPYRCLDCDFMERRFDPTRDEYPPRTRH